MSEDPFVVAQRALEADLAQGWSGWNDDQLAYLRAHRWLMLATGRKDGSPQVSMVGYALDDDGAILISAKQYTAKQRNARRQPKVGMIVHDDRRQLVIYGVAETVEADPRRAELSAKVMAVLGGNPIPDPSALVPMLDAQQRTVLRVVPTGAFFQG
jgi:PPOX class probable F420-dependent enzyme